MHAYTRDTRISGYKNVAHVKIKTNLHASSVEAVIIVIVQNNSHNHPNKSNNQRLSMCMVK
jgi:hypothetical protein